MEKGNTETLAPNRPLAACGPARCELALRGGDREAEGRGGTARLEFLCVSLDCQGGAKHYKVLILLWML